MIVYLDTGVFFDYFIKHSQIGAAIRRGSRRGRSRSRLFRDVNSCFHKLLTRNHNPITSSLTLFELEDAIFKEISLDRDNRGVSHRLPFLVSTARVAIVQGMTTAHLYNIRLLNLSESTVSLMITNIALQHRGIQAADSLHIASAIVNQAEMIISTDAHIIRLDNQFQNANGHSIRCVDTDVALTLL